MLVTWGYRKKPWASDHGSAISELVLVLPLLVLFLTTTFEISRAVSQMSWMSQTTFEAVRSASNVQGVAGEEIMKDVGELYFNVLSKGQLKDNSDFLIPEFKSDEGLVTAHAQGKMNFILGAVEIPVSLRATAAIFELTSPGNLSEYSNMGYYACDGTPCGAGAPCAETPCCLTADTGCAEYYEDNNPPSIKTPRFPGFAAAYSATSYTSVRDVIEVTALETAQEVNLDIILGSGSGR